jgi:hypothetical protein
MDVELTKLEKWTVRITSAYISAILYDDLFCYLLFGISLVFGLEFTLLWLKNWTGGDW